MERVQDPPICLHHGKSCQSNWRSAIAYCCLQKKMSRALAAFVTSTSVIVMRAPERGAVFSWSNLRVPSPSFPFPFSFPFTSVFIKTPKSRKGPLSAPRIIIECSCTCYWMEIWMSVSVSTVSKPTSSLPHSFYPQQLCSEPCTTLLC